MFVADDLAAWLIGLLADAGRKRLTTLVLGSEQERALRSAATAAVQRTAAELRPGDDERAEQLAMVVSEVFHIRVPGAQLVGQATVLEELQAGIAGQLAVLDDASLTGIGRSSAQLLGTADAAVATKLTGHLVREIVVRGSRGGPLFPLASQLNDDITHLQGVRIEAVLGQLADEVRQALALLGGSHAIAAVATALAQLPATTAGFTGRDDELALLADLLGPADSVGSVVAGLAGVGKTTLAVQAGHAARERGWFGGGVLFLDLHGYDEAPVEAMQALDALLRALGVPAEHIPPSVEERAGLYRSVLARVGEPVLVIADNASAEAQVKPLLPGAGPHKILVTSRHTLAGLGARLVDVTVLDEASAIDLLDQALRAARPDDDRISADTEAAARLAVVCGGLPLALQIVGALLKADPALSSGELAGQLADEKDRLAVLRYDDGSSTSGPSVAAAFGLSYHRLDEAVGRVFRLLSASSGPDVSTDSAAVLTDLPSTEVRRVLARLGAAHLIEAAPGMGGRWRMHDLVRLYAKQESDERAQADGREQAWDRLFASYLEMASAARRLLQALPDTSANETFTSRADALAWLDAERPNLVAAVAMAADTGRDQIAMRLPSTLSGYFDWRRRFDDELATSAVGLDAARRLGDPDGEGIALNNLGTTLRQVRRFDEAITAHQEAVAISRKTGDRRSEGGALTNLGTALVEVRRFEKAVAAQQDAVVIFRKTDNRRSEGGALNNLGLALHQVRRFDEAITAHQEAVAIYRRTDDRHSEGIALNNLGNALLQVRRFDEAITAHQKAVAIYRKTGDRHREGGARKNLGLVLLEMGRYEEAIRALQNAAAIYRETGDRHGEAGALANLGTALAGVRRFDEAITAHQEAVAIYRKTGDRHSEGMTLTNLGPALRGAGRFEEAITALKDAAAIYRETGDRHGEGGARINLGLTLCQIGRSKEAITPLKDAAAIYRETGDLQREGTALTGLGWALKEVRWFDDAITACQDAAAIFRETGDRDGEGMALRNLEAVRAAQQNRN